MTFALSIIACGLIGWFVPRVAVRRIGGAAGFALGCIGALALGAAAVWLLAQLLGTAGLGDADAEFERGFNAWKFMILLAPASALHARKQAADAATDQTPDGDA